MRCIVFGNSGAGKSTLAQALANAHGLAHLDLDTIAWQKDAPGAPTRASHAESVRAFDAFAQSPAAQAGWVAEGCYADLLTAIAPRASHAYYVDLSIAACQDNARARPWEPHKYPSKAAQDANLPMLLAWIAAYPTREGPLSQSAHHALYAGFAGAKTQLRTRDAVTAVLSALPSAE